MHRLTARLLLILLLVGVFVPVALAISTPAPHACCLRMRMHDSRNQEFHAPPACCNHDCCRPLTVSQWAGLQREATTCVALPATRLQSATLHAHVLGFSYRAPSVRGPPPFSIA
ncbi:MAG: hypothetical protein WB952_11325 [Terriglobales bacterium]